MSREMKLTNLDCIQQIPLNWKMMDIKYVSSLINGDRSDQYPSGSDIKDSGVNFITSENLHNLKLEIVENSKYITAEKYNSLRGAKLRINDLIFCLRGSLGICSINTDLTEGTIASSLVVIRPNDKINPYYLNYSINSNIIRKQIDYWMNGSCAANLSAKDTREFKICVPPISEQNQIVNYLNSKCEAIDQAIQKKKDIVIKLKEYKQSTITQAVTKGLNPDVEMKEVSMDFTNSIPQNWECSRLKYHCKITNGADPKTEGNIPVYGSGSEIVKYCGEFKNGPAILIGRKGTLDKPQLVEGKYWNVDTAMDLHPYSHMNPKYLYYVISCFTIDKYSTCTAKPSMTQEDYYNILVPVPSVLEQNEIVEYIDSKCDSIDESIERSNKIIQKLEEYKKALIYNAVTGKIDCRNA